MSIIDRYRNHQDVKEIRKNAERILHRLSVEIGERTLRRYDRLEETRAFITERLSATGHAYAEEYTVEGKTVANIVAEIPGTERPNEIIVIGAHYDTVEGTPGADDNGSAVTGLLEMFRLLSARAYRRTLRFVAFTLEEPPYFLTKDMGSMRYAKGCRERKELIRFMVCLEMIGYAGRSIEQQYPIREMKERFPRIGDFLTVVSLPSSSPYTYLWKRVYNQHAKKAVHELIGPASIPGIDFSDHCSFCRNGFPAIMLTDTAFYRNKAYHTEHDTYDTINFDFLADVIRNSARTLAEIADMDELPVAECGC
ncbi:MAG TPA: M28 family peptidase [Spirochaetota bacterium]|nr:M28 family peptidase [Spirochaetota bacterium]HNT09449.1 M28 family peptidase [Spirochaetota bacterium]